MNITMHAEFGKQLEGLEKSVKAKAFDFMTKITRDHDATGLDLKLPQQARDRRVRTARVDQNYRAVMFLVGSADSAHFILAAILPHDDAYEWAERAQVRVNASSGAAELDVTPVETVPPPRPPERPFEPDAEQVLPFGVEELTALGIDEDLARRVTVMSDEADLLAAVDHLPRWQSSLLLDLASGRSLDDVRRDYVITPVAAEDADDDHQLEQALARPSSRMEFAPVTDDNDLRRVLAGDFQAWRVFLHPTQRAVAYRDRYNGPFRLNGGAGTGKTVVALHRAVHLATSDPEATVLMCTFNRTLADALRSDLSVLAATEVLSRIHVLGVDQVARQVLARGSSAVPSPVDDRTEVNLWQEAADLTSASGLGAEFLREEYRDVILAQACDDRSAYFKAPRRGRGARLDRAQRADVWRAAEQFQALLRQQNRTTFTQIAADAAAQLSASQEGPPYRYVVVDEGQDLHPAHWRMLRAVVPSAPNDMFICEDSHQRLYGQKVVLSRVGIETRGRSRRLTLNYRTTRQILALSLAVLRGETVVDLEGEAESTDGYRSAMSGAQPVLQGYTTRDNELDGVVGLLTEMAAAESEPGSVGALVRRQRDANELLERLRQSGVPARLVGRDQPAGTEVVHVATMHRAKGSQYRRVVVARVDDRTVPDPMAVRGGTEDDVEDRTARERFLLYVACTRARDQLAVTWSGTPSRFLPVAP